jgi:hypothetical protein
MKWMLSIGLLLLFLFVACNGNKQVPEPVEGPSSALSAVDSLMWQQPDSALALLQDYLVCRDVACNVLDENNTIKEDVARYVSTTEYDRHYANLLLAELLYKNYYPQTNRCELQQGVAYFDSLLLVTGKRRAPAKKAAHTYAFLAARTHYINGVGYYEHDSVVEACMEYLKGLEMMEEFFEEKELVGKKAKFMALTYTHLTGLFSDLYLHEQAIYLGKASLKYYQKYDAEPWHIAWMLNLLGSHFEILDNYDSAFYYCNQGLRFLTDTNNLTYRDLSAHLAFLAYKDGTPPLSSLQKLNDLLVRSESKQEYISRCLTIGEVYYHERLFDSAWLYLNIVYKETKSISSKKQAAEWLVDIYKILGEKDEMIKYAEFLVPFANHEENKSEIKSQVTELYNEFGQNKLEQQHQKEISRHLKWFLMAFSGMSLIILIIMVINHNNKQKKHHLESQIYKEKQTHNMEQKALSGRLKKSNEALRELKDQIKQQNRGASSLAQTPTISFVDEPICQLIMKHVEEGRFKSQMDCTIYKNYALTKEQIMALHEAVNHHFYGFTMRLKKMYPQLTDNDLNYCCLYLLGLTDADIAALMQRAYNTINERNSKLRRIFGSENSICITLHTIANESLSN